MESDNKTGIGLSEAAQEPTLRNRVTRSVAQNDTPQSPLHDVAAKAAVSAPLRRRKAPHDKKVDAYIAGLVEFSMADEYMRENEYIRRGYRAGYNFKRSLRSLFSLHNETGNVWTHLIGFMIFLSLTFATFHLRPEPLRLGTEAITKLEQRLYDVGKNNLYDLLQSAEAWERHVVKFGQEKLNGIESVLREIRRENLHELAQLRHRLSKIGDTITNVTFSDVGQVIKDYSRSGMAELHSMEEKISQYSSDTVTDVELAVHRALAGLLDTTWPAKRWPIYVFLSGAMLCLLTSAVCHLFGCCGAHVSLIIWRFDYAGIAVLIVASFFPPVYYAFMCQPKLKLFYLTVTTLLGLATLSVSLLDRFQQPTLMPFRAALFVALGSWGLVPMLHAASLNIEVPEFGSAMRLHWLMGLIYVLGAVIYAARIPERWYPGAFDMAFQSHQIFHVAVVIAAVVHYRASNVLVTWRDATGGCLSMPS